MRTPAPYVRRRIPSGRGATEQPNVTSETAALTPRFWLAVLVTGVAAGLLGIAMMAILFTVEAVAFGGGPFLAAVERSHGWARVAPLLIAGAVAGPAWYLLRRFTKGQRSELDDALWSGDGSLSVRRSVGTSVLSELVIGTGASIGRESAPKLLGGLSGSVLAGPLRLTAEQRRLLVACGAGAGLAAVYNVPVAGALFTAEVLLGSIALPTVLPALACSGVATLTGWLYLHSHAVYPDVPAYHFRPAELVWALLAGPLIGLVAAGWIRLVAWVSYHRVGGRWAAAAPLAAFAVLAVIGLRYPQLFGNGKDMANLAFLGDGTVGLFLVLGVLKPLVTALCLESGASGGLLTPSMSTGAVLGAGLGLAWSHLWPGGATGAYGVIGGAAMLAAAMQAPLTGLVLMLEMTHSGFGIAVPVLAAVVTATVVARRIDGYSIYSGRLAPHERPARTLGPWNGESGHGAAPPPSPPS